MLGDVVLQHLDGLLVLAHRDKEFGLLQDVKQLFRVDDVGCHGGRRGRGSSLGLQRGRRTGRWAGCHKAWLHHHRGGFGQGACIGLGAGSDSVGLGF